MACWDPHQMTWLAQGMHPYVEWQTTAASQHLLLRRNAGDHEKFQKRVQKNALAFRRLLVISSTSRAVAAQILAYQSTAKTHHPNPQASFEHQQACPERRPASYHQP
ncbi:hypothetical protein PanWU01x14_108800 [Parasponia andersonii]|uniref:Uncharacterized protein n=1 Tax=Parasponia andersonii TaxID=3476 RepID=A0A2P5D013_PARAD|nr:hypothetical protein PanWU01x14_108800 [Parasponia andersonii]